MLLAIIWVFSGQRTETHEAIDGQYFLGSRGKGWITDRTMTEKAKSPERCRFDIAPGTQYNRWVETLLSSDLISG